MVRKYIGQDVHKSSVYVTAMDEEGNVCESYYIENTESSLNQFKTGYLDMRPEILFEVSILGKYITIKLRDMGFSLNFSDPSKLSLIFKTAKKNDRENSYKKQKSYNFIKISYIQIFVYTNKAYFKIDAFYYVNCYNDYYGIFLKFLDSTNDVNSYDKIISKVSFIVEYKDSRGNL